MGFGLPFPFRESRGETAMVYSATEDSCRGDFFWRILAEGISGKPSSPRMRSNKKSLPSALRTPLILPLSGAARRSRPSLHKHRLGPPYRGEDSILLDHGVRPASLPMPDVHENPFLTRKDALRAEIAYRRFLAFLCLAHRSSSL